MTTPSRVAGAARELVTSQTPEWVLERTVRLLDVDPDLAEGLSDREAELARRHMLALAVGVPTGQWTPPVRLRGALMIMLESGTLLHQHHRSGVADLQMVASSECFDPVLMSDPDATWQALTPSQLVVVDHRTFEVARRLPAISHALIGRMFEAHHEQQARLALRAFPRVDDRLTSLFAQLAGRSGKVTPLGLSVDLPVTHEQLGLMVGAKRPTVSIAVKHLQRVGRLQRIDTRRWLLPAPTSHETNVAHGLDEQPR